MIRCRVDRGVGRVLGVGDACMVPFRIDVILNDFRTLESACTNLTPGQHFFVSELPELSNRGRPGFRERTRLAGGPTRSADDPDNLRPANAARTDQTRILGNGSYAHPGVRAPMVNRAGRPIQRDRSAAVELQPARLHVEIEDYQVNLEGVRVLELAPIPISPRLMHMRRWSDGG